MNDWKPPFLWRRRMKTTRRTSKYISRLWMQAKAFYLMSSYLPVKILTGRAWGWHMTQDEMTTEGPLMTATWEPWSGNKANFVHLTFLPSVHFCNPLVTHHLQLPEIPVSSGNSECSKFHYPALLWVSHCTPRFMHWVKLIFFLLICCLFHRLKWSSRGKRNHLKFPHLNKRAEDVAQHESFGFNTQFGKIKQKFPAGRSHIMSLLQSSIGQCWHQGQPRLMERGDRRPLGGRNWWLPSLPTVHGARATPESSQNLHLWLSQIFSDNPVIIGYLYLSDFFFPTELKYASCSRVVIWV